MTDNLLDPTIRLFESLANPRDAAILGELIVDEIYYRILCDEQGGDLKTLELLLHKKRDTDDTDLHGLCQKLNKNPCESVLIRVQKLNLSYSATGLFL